MMIYKGASPGTYWHNNDPRLSGGFTAGRQHAAASHNMAVAHITQSSQRSPFISFTYSFAVAVQYALVGATATNPGRVYEIDPTVIRPDSIFDPVELLVKATPRVHDHDGGQNLIIGLSDPRQRSILFTPPIRPSGAPPAPPRFMTQLEAVIKAIRDAEVLITTSTINSTHIRTSDVY